jgi:CDP-paratose 2-epimerase
VVVVDWRRDNPPGLGALRELGVSVVQGDISEPDVWQRLGRCDYVLHAAAQVSAERSREEPLRDFQTNLIGTLRAAEFALEQKAGLVYFGSSRMYAPEAVEAEMRSRGAVSEICATVRADDATQPPFAHSKLLAETVLLQLSRTRQLRFVSHRLGGIVGPGQTGSVKHGWVANFVGRALKGEFLTIFGDGKQTRDILHVDDLVTLIELELGDFDRFAMNGDGIYNVGGGPSAEISPLDVIHWLEADHGLTLEYRFAEPRAGEPQQYASDIGKIRCMGWEPRRVDPRALVGEMVDSQRGANVAG